ncbi:MAG: WhiB family transcriptional regulator [Bifidobacterium choerinum]
MAVQRGFCAGLPYGVQDLMWGPERLNDPRRQRALSAAAVVLCEMCPLRARCTADALAVEDQHGMFGGLVVKERRQLARLAVADGVPVGASQRERARLAAWLGAHPEAFDQARLMCAEEHRTNRGGPRARATAPLRGMERAVAFVSARQGSGTTTGVLSVAFALCRAGQRVRVVDLDPAGACLSWAARAAKAGRMVPFDVCGPDAPDMDGDVWTLLDAPSCDGPAMETAADRASLAVVSTCADERSLEAARRLTHLLGVPSSVVVTRAADAGRARDAQRWLDDRHVARTIAHIREDPRARGVLAGGALPVVSIGYSALANELMGAFHARRGAPTAQPPAGTVDAPTQPVEAGETALVGVGR